MTEKKTIVTRFPPSPTGFMHVGNARTALFNWLYAQHMGGKMVFRIEDTDRERHSEAAVQAIINGMTWLGLDWDGEIISQFSRRERHAEVANELLASGKAYRCYCTPEELDEMRVKAKAEGKPTFYDRRWRDSTATPPEGVKPVIRIKAPLSGSSTVHDHVQGEVTVNNEQLDDMIILRSDGTPVYHLAVVVDDHDMGVTHVIRGDDHLNNTFRQNVIIEAMGWALPEYAHVPLILSEDGSKMSKRKGAASLEEFRDMGYLPETMGNYLLKLGWGHGDDEIISREQAIEWFDLGGIVKSPARWDYDKLDHLNAHYIRAADTDRLIGLCLPFYKSRHNVEPDPQAQSRIKACADELKSRAKTLLQFVDESVFFAKSLPFAYDEKAAALLGQDARPVLEALLEALKAAPDFTHETVQNACKDVAGRLEGGKLGKVAMPLRAALTGTTVSPSIFHAAEILGREETCARILAALERAR
jgi:glutamyl-tRNA synthetase